MTTTNYDNVLRDIYYDPKAPASFGSYNKLYKAAKLINNEIKLSDVKNWLSGELTYTLHKNARKNFKREKIFVTSPLEQFQADLVDMKKYSRYNQGFKYILTVIDCFSRFAFAQPLKNKTGIDVRNAFKNIFETSKPSKLQTDRGKEFLNKPFQDYLKNNEIHFFNTYNTKIKCAIVERFNLTLKTKIIKYMESYNTKNYVNQLQNIVNSYNNSTHRTIGLEPINVNDSNKNIIFNKIYGYPTPREYLIAKSVKPKLVPGDKIRRKYELTPMDKSYEPKWTDEIFTVEKAIKGNQRPMYFISTIDKRILPQKVYPEEIQKVKENLYRIEKIVKNKTINGRKGFIVKWLNYSSEHNSWIPEDDLLAFNAQRRNN